MPAVCAKCVHLHGSAAKLDWWRWMCVKAPIAQKFNPVTGDTVADPPFMWCRYRNTEADCLDFSEGPNILHPKVPDDKVHV